MMRGSSATGLIVAALFTACSAARGTAPTISARPEADAGDADVTGEGHEAGARSEERPEEQPEATPEELLSEISRLSGCGTDQLEVLESFGGTYGRCQVVIERWTDRRGPFLDVAVATAYTGGDCRCFQSALFLLTPSGWSSPLDSGSMYCERGWGCGGAGDTPPFSEPSVIQSSDGPRVVLTLLDTAWDPDISIDLSRFGRDATVSAEAERLLILGLRDGAPVLEVDLVVSPSIDVVVPDEECFEAAEAEGLPMAQVEDDCTNTETLLRWRVHVEVGEDRITLSPPPAAAGTFVGAPPPWLLGSHDVAGLERLLRGSRSSYIQDAIDDRAGEIPEGDRRLVETGDARQMGERCFEHLRAGRHAEAREVCLAGLARSTDPGQRGALLYNLGRVAEAQGRRDLARRYYRRSLAARPGNATVRRRLEALGDD